VEDVDDGGKAIFRLQRSPSRLGPEQAIDPKRLVTLQDRDHEVFLRQEVPVQRGLRDPGLGDDPIDSDSGEAFL
jgi:hypothetical protein